MKTKIKLISATFLLTFFISFTASAMEDNEINKLSSSISKLSIDRIGWTKFLEIILEDLAISSSDSDNEIEYDFCRLSTSWEWNKKCFAHMYLKIIEKFPEAKRIFDFSKPEFYSDGKSLKNNLLDKVDKTTAQACLKMRLLSTSNRATLLNESTGIKFGPFQNQGYIMVAAVSPDNKKVLTGSRNNTAVLWDVEKSNQIYTFQHNDWVTGTAIFSDKYGEYALTGAIDGTAVLWDIKTGAFLCRFNHGRGILSVGLTADGDIKTTSLETEKVWSIVHFKMLSFSQFFLAIKLQRCMESNKSIYLNRKWRKNFNTLPKSLKIKFGQTISKKKIK